MSLHVFKNKVVDWVVAASPEDAREVIKEQYGHDELTDDGQAFDFEQLPDEEDLAIRADDGTARVATCREWSAGFGRGLLASTEV